MSFQGKRKQSDKEAWEAAFPIGSAPRPIRTDEEKALFEKLWPECWNPDSATPDCSHLTHRWNAIVLGSLDASRQPSGNIFYKEVGHISGFWTVRMRQLEDDRRKTANPKTANPPVALPRSVGTVPRATGVLSQPPAGGEGSSAFMSGVVLPSSDTLGGGLQVPAYTMDAGAAVGVGDGIAHTPMSGEMYRTSIVATNLAAPVFGNYHQIKRAKSQPKQHVQHKCSVCKKPMKGHTKEMIAQCKTTKEVSKDNQ